MTALVSFERVFEVLDLPPMVAEKADARALPRGHGARRVRPRELHLPDERRGLAGLARVGGRARPRRPAGEVLHDVSFSAEPGQLVALVGPSGAGKTTISQLVPRLYDVTLGRGAHQRRRRARRHAGLAARRDRRGHPGRAPVPRHACAPTCCTPSRTPTDDELRDALRSAQILPLVESLPDGLDTVVGDRGYRLSGGEKQRVAIARLLLKAPDVVVLDEATAHLDSESERAVQVALKTALAGRTSLVIAHRLSTVRDADQILVLRDGRIVRARPPRGTARRRRPLRRAVPHAVPRPGLAGGPGRA